MNSSRLKREAGLALLIGFAATIAFALMLAGALGAPFRSAGASLILYLAVAAVVWGELPRHAPHTRFGLGNAITLLRGAVILALGGLVLAPQTLSAEPWLPLGLAAACLALDGLDGLLARRARLASDFGAWFDQELDGLFVLVLAALAWVSGQLGPWILAIGAYRYLFLLAGRLFPALARPLPYSRRRRAACAFSIAALIACLAPTLPEALILAAGASAMAVMTGSFAIDVLWLIERQGEAK